MNAQNANRAASIVALLLCLAAENLTAQTDSLPIILGQQVRLSSKILNEERTISIYTPGNYDNSTSTHPVLYLLDGGTHFQHVATLTAFLSEAYRIPQMMVVGVHNTDRVRDFTPVHSLVGVDGKIDSALFATTGGGDNFLKFLRQELIPYVDRNYRTQPYRILEGHSLGGMFATYVLEAAPDLFNDYIIISAAFYGGNETVLTNFGSYLQGHRDLSKFVFVSIGKEPDLQKGVNSLVQQLTVHAPKSLKWTFKEYEDEDHISVPHLSMYDGLRFIYHNWWIDHFDTTKVASLEDLEKHFRLLSTEFGYEITVPEITVNSFGYSLLYVKKAVDEAISVFQYNVKNYPASFNVYDSLAEAYMVKGEKEMAIANYEKSIELNPNNENGKKMLTKLRSTNKK